MIRRPKTEKEVAVRQSFEVRAVDLQAGVITVRRALSENEPVLPKSLVRVGANLEAVRELAGHSKLQTTQRYVHATGADHRDAIARFPGN